MDLTGFRRDYGARVAPSSSMSVLGAAVDVLRKVQGEWSKSQNRPLRFDRRTDLPKDNISKNTNGPDPGQTSGTDPQDLAPSGVRYRVKSASQR